MAQSPKHVVRSSLPDERFGHGALAVNWYPLPRLSLRSELRYDWTDYVNGYKSFDKNTQPIALRLCHDGEILKNCQHPEPNTECSSHLLAMELEHPIDALGAFQDDVDHDHHDGGEEELVFVLKFGGGVEKAVHAFGLEVALENGSNENGNGGFVGEGLLSKYKKGTRKFPTFV